LDTARPAAFSYSRALAPLMWVFACIMTLELVVVHLLVAGLSSHLAAAILSAVSLAALVWTVAFVSSLKRRPVLVDAAGVTMRIGSLKSVRVPAASMKAVLTSWPRERLKQRGVLNFALIDYPNVMLELDPPLQGRRPVHTIAHRLDDPAGFVAAIRQHSESQR